jgi:hypothetical protein
MSVSRTAQGVRETDIVERSGGTKSTVGAALRDLVDRGEIERYGTGRAHSPFMYRRVQPPGGDVFPGDIGAGRSMSPTGGLPPQGGRALTPGETGHATSVGDQMAAIFEPVDDEPEDTDQPDDVTSIAVGLFGDGPGPGAAGVTGGTHTADLEHLSSRPTRSLCDRRRHRFFQASAR